jgi:tetratricopeptide (TPR) repeat protein
MMRHLLLLLTLLAAMPKPTARAQRNIGVNINLLPMYGGARKSKKLQAADARFLAASDRNEPNRAVAATQLVKRGMDYFRAGDHVTAMKRFNQAWLLDSTNADIYWGYGILRGEQGNYDESVRFLSNSLKRQPDNQALTADLASTLLQRYDTFRAKPDLERSIVLSELCVSRETSQPDSISQVLAYTNLAIGYFFKQDYARAWEWTDRARRLDPGAVAPAFLEQLRQAAPRQD